MSIIETRTTLITFEPISRYPVNYLDGGASDYKKYFSWFTESIKWFQNTYYLFRPELTIRRMEYLLQPNNSNNTARKYRRIASISSLFQSIYVITDPRIAFQILSKPRNPDPDLKDEQFTNGGALVETIRTIFDENIFTYHQTKNSQVRELYKARLIDKGKSYIESLYTQAQNTSISWLNISNKINVSEETKAFVAHAVICNLLQFNCDISRVREAVKILTQAIREITFCKFPRTSDADISWAKKAMEQAIATIKEDDNFVTDLKKAQERLNMTDKEVNNAINGIFFAAQDTTTNTMAFLLYNLGKNLQWQDDIFNEWMEWKERNKKEQGPAFQSYIESEKTILHACLLETLRLTPPAYIQMRQSIKDFFINDDLDQTSTFIPQGTNLLIANFFIQRDERWKNGEEFHPERFLENTNAPTFYPFSVGSNMCVGRVFARYEIKSLLLALIEKGAWTTINENLKLTSTLALTTIDDIYIDYQPRETFTY